MAKSKFTAEDGRNFFRRLAKEGAWAPVFLLTGTESYLLDEAVDRLIQTVFPDKPDDFNFSIFDAKDHGADDVVAACEQLPMFADRRVVRVRNVDSWKANILQSLADYIARPSDTTLLILQADSFPLKSGAAKSIVQSKDLALMEFNGLSEAECVQWVVRRGKNSHGLLLRQDVAQNIVEKVGDSLEALDRALEKLRLFLGKPQDEQGSIVSHEDVEEIIVDARMRSVFELTNALSERNLEQSIRIYRRMRLHGDSPIGAVSMIARQFRSMLLLQEGSRSGADEASLAQLMGAPSWMLKKYQAPLRQFPGKELRAIVEAIAHTNTLLTSSRLSDDLHVERLILAICTKNGALALRNAPLPTL